MTVQSNCCVPQLSIVIASAHSSQDTDRFLNTIKLQHQDKNIEMIVADCSYDEPTNILVRKHPEVLFCCFPKGTSLPTLWGAGISRATGNIIAVTDSQCIPDDQWITAILAAHESPHPVIGGAVESTGPKKLVDWAAYFCEYGQFMRPLPEGVVSVLPGNNISFKRWLLEKGKEFVENGFWKTYWCRKLQEEGIQLVSVPSILVYDTKSYRLMPFLIRRFFHGRCFGGMRITHISLPRRVFYMIGSPLLPFLFIGRTVRTMACKRRYVREFVLSFPISILAIVSWSIGEFWGYLMGPGNSCHHIH